MLINTFVRRARQGAFAVVCLGLSQLAFATSPDGAWSDVAERTITTSSNARQIVPERYRTVRLDRSRFLQLTAAAPLERTQSVEASPALLELPLADGSYGTFRIAESPVMEAGLAKRYPGIRTWIGQGVDDPSATLRFDYTPKGFHAQILSATGTTYIDPYQRGDVDNYIAYRKQDHHHGEGIRCSVTGQDVSKESLDAHAKHLRAKLSSGGTLRTYRLAMAATGEYTAFHGGSKADALAAIVSTVNRVNGIYEREVSVRMVLVADNDRIIFTNAGSDPYANTSGDLPANQTTINAQIGSTNYDVGHLVGTGGGGVAQLGVICATNKARGLTGSGSPVGDGFDVDYVAHEMGHQFSGNHTFNGSDANCSAGNRNSLTAYEPGSGVTIQAYAGICGVDNLQPNSEDYFHRVSLNEIIAHTTTGSGGTCGTTVATGNAIPTVTPAGAAFTIPALTPFELTATGNDGDAGDVLTYVWEEFDLGTANAAGSLADAGNRALFRSFAPSTQASRVFPSLRYILNNANEPPATAPLEGTAAPAYFTGELLPSTNRNMNFRVTVRDNRAAGGGTNEALTVLDIEPAAGPFAVTAPNTAVVWAAGSTQNVTWNVANTSAAPVSTANVRITLSLDGGYTWPVELAASEANDGAATITVPAGTPATAVARVRVSAVGNVYFDVSNTNFTITGTNTPPVIAAGAAVSTRQGAPAANAVVATVSDGQDSAGSLAVSAAGVPAELGVSVSNAGGQVTMIAAASCSLVAPTSGTRAYPIRLDVTDSGGATTASFVNVNVASNRAPTLGAYTSAAVARSTVTPFAPAAGPADPDGNYDDISVSPLVLPGGGTVAVAANGTVTVTTTAGTNFGAHIVRVQALDDCGAAEIREFTVTVAATTPVLDLTASTVVTGNGLIEPAECNQLNLTIANTGTVTATGVSATLSTITPNVTITQPVAAFADIPAGQSRTSLTSFEVSSEAGLVCLSNIDFSLNVTYGGGGSPYVDTLTLQAGQPAAVNYVFATSNDAAIPAGGVLVAGSSADDALVNVTVPFGFSLYGNAITAGTVLRASTNGTLQFAPSGGSREYDNTALPNDGVGNYAGDSFPAASPVLMPFWDDLTLLGAGGGIYTVTTGTAPNRQWTIEWRGQQYVQTPGALNTRFAIVFNEGGSGFEYHYVQTSGGTSAGGASATIGLQAATTGTTFTQFSLNSASVVAGTRLVASRPAGTCNSGTGACVTGPGVSVVQSGGATAATEGASDSYTMVLRTQPTADVTIALADDADVDASPASLTFTTLNWNVPQTVTVNAVDDRIVEGAHAGTISHTVSGGDYAAVTVANVVATLADNDTAAYRFATASGSAAESAGSVNIAVDLAFTTVGTGSPALETAITVPVTVAAASTATGGGVDYTLGSASVAIPADGASQNVSVALVNTPTAEVSETVILDLGAETGGSAGQQAAVTAGAPARHTLTITDGNTAGVVLVESAGDTSVTEGGAGDTYTLVLTSQPTANVSIAITPDAELTTTPTGLTFTTANWNVAQTVTVNAVNDTDIEGAHAGTLAHVASGGGYTGVAVAGLSVDITDNDFAADLAVANVRLPGAVLPGELVRFEVTVNNLSQTTDVPVAAFDFTVAPALVSPQWTCTPEAGATCPASGSGLPSHDIALPRDTGVLYVVSGTVPAAATVGTVYTATATIDATAPTTDPNAANDSASATATVDPYAIFRDGFETP